MKNAFLLIATVLMASQVFASGVPKTEKCENENSGLQATLSYVVGADKPVKVKLGNSEYVCRGMFTLGDNDMMEGIRYHYCMVDGNSDILLKWNVIKDTIQVNTISIYATETIYQCQ